MKAQPRGRPETATARTIRFPQRVRERVALDAERCGRSFEAQVIAILRRHFGEDVDIAPAPDVVLQLARGSFAGVPTAQQRVLAARLTEGRR